MDAESDQSPKPLTGDKRRLIGVSGVPLDTETIAAMNSALNWTNTCPMTAVVVKAEWIGARGSPNKRFVTTDLRQILVLYGPDVLSSACSVSVFPVPRNSAMHVEARKNWRDWLGRIVASQSQCKCDASKASLKRRLDSGGDSASDAHDAPESSRCTRDDG